MSFDHELKIRRAFHHLMELDNQVKPWVNDERHTSRCEVQPDTSRIYFATAEQPAKYPLSLLIGDALHNLRSGLDTLAFALACKYTDPLPDVFAFASAFPITGDRDKSRATGVGHGHFHKLKRNGTPAPDGGLAKIQGWHPKAQAVVEGLQPYQRGNSFDHDPLWIILNELDRVSKHRLFHVGVMGIAGARFFFNPGDNLAGIQGGYLEVLSRPIETDTPFAVCTSELMPIDPNKEVYMDIPLIAQVAFAPGTPAVENESVYKTLADIYAYIKLSVLPPLEVCL